MTIAEIIKAAGGRLTVATRVGLTAWAIDKWAKSGIPEKYWADIHALSEGKVSLADLHEANLAARSEAA